MKIALLTGCGEPAFSSNQGLIHAFRVLGHEVIVLGPRYWERFLGDVELPDKKHPELYSYSEVLEKLPWNPNVIGCLEPHGFLTGPKPPELKSFFFLTDPHAAGHTYHKIAEEGNFNVVFCGQPYFTPLFLDIPNTRAVTLPCGFDERRFPVEDVGSACDISLVGFTGIANMEYPYEDGRGKYATHPPQNLPQDYRRYASHPTPSYDYAERAEILIRLCNDFDVRMYQTWKTPQFQCAIQSGEIGFNCSLLNDVGIRCFETLAAGRLLLTDEVPTLHETLGGHGYVTYRKRFRPFYQNFDLDYQEIYQSARWWLGHDNAREEEAKLGKDRAWKHYSWTVRAKSLIEAMN